MKKPPLLQTITANSQTGICASFKTWYKTVKMPFTSSQAVKLLMFLIVIKRMVFVSYLKINHTLKWYFKFKLNEIIKWNDTLSFIPNVLNKQKLDQIILREIHMISDINVDILWAKPFKSRSKKKTSVNALIIINRVNALFTPTR